MKNIIVLDVGTTGMRLIIYNEVGKVKFSSYHEYNSDFVPPGFVTQNPLTWKNTLENNFKEAKLYIDKEKVKIAAISITSQRSSVIPVDREGNHLYPAIMWQDKRSIAICDKLLKKMSMQKIYKKTGLRMNPYFALPKMVWLKENEPQIYKQAYKLICVQDYLVKHLTGNFVSDWSHGCRTALMNIKTFKWDADMIKLGGIDKNKLVDLVAPGSIGGHLTKRYAEMIGLPEETPVVLSGGDQQNAAVGLNVIKPGVAEANFGTGAFMLAYSDKPAFDAKCRVLCGAAAIPGKYVIEAGMFNAGAIYRWIRNEFYNKEEGVNVEYEVINEEAMSSPIGAKGVMCVPHYEGCSAPHWNSKAKGLFFNLSLGTKRGDIARAVLEGIANEMAENAQLIQKMIGDLKELSIAGGLARSQFFNQICADSFNTKVAYYENPEASALGALINACVTLKIYKNHNEAFKNIVPDKPAKLSPIKKNVPIYAEHRKRKDHLYDALNEAGIYDEFMIKE